MMCPFKVCIHSCFKIEYGSIWKNLNFVLSYVKRQNFFIPAEKEEYLNTVIFVFFLNFLNSIVILSTVCGNCGIKTFIYHSFCLREREWSFYWTFNYISLQLLCLLIAYMKNLSEHWTPSVMARIGFWND